MHKILCLNKTQDGEILCDPVDKITGPGNIFVATAKRTPAPRPRAGG